MSTHRQYWLSSFHAAGVAPQRRLNPFRTVRHMGAAKFRLLAAVLAVVLLAPWSEFWGPESSLLVVAQVHQHTTNPAETADMPSAGSQSTMSISKDTVFVIVNGTVQQVGPPQQPQPGQQPVQEQVQPSALDSASVRVAANNQKTRTNAKHTRGQQGGSSKGGNTAGGSSSGSRGNSGSIGGAGKASGSSGNSASSGSSNSPGTTHGVQLPGGSVEDLQYEALRQYLPKLLVVDAITWPLVDGLFKTAPAKLREWIPETHPSGTMDYSEFITKRGWGYISATVARFNGVLYITELYAFDAGLDLRVLPDLVSQLPRLQSFTCSQCWRNINAASKRTSGPLMELPANLADRAPPSLTMLSLGGCKIKGTLPESWSKWDTLEQLWVWDNDLTGGIPETWSNMKGLRVFYAEQNSLTGSLPASWGNGSMPQTLAVYLHKNKKVSGAVPSSWGRFTGVIDVTATNVTGCVPDSLLDNIIMDGAPEPCTGDDPNREQNALVQIRNGLRQLLGDSILPTWLDEGKLVNGLPVYCVSWAGIECNSKGSVTTLDISTAAPVKGKFNVPLAKIMQFVKRLQFLEVLNLSDLGLTGPLEEDKVLSDDLGNLAMDLNYLKVLNISGNINVTGELPKMWAGLSNLEVLDVSQTGIKSKLPSSWASLQKLKLFRGFRTGIYGQLPPSWGLMKNIVEIDLMNCQLTGPLPPMWADALAMQQVAVAAVETAQRDAQDAAAAAAQAMDSITMVKEKMKHQREAKQPAALLLDPTMLMPGAAAPAPMQPAVTATYSDPAAAAVAAAATPAAFAVTSATAAAAELQGAMAAYQDVAAAASTAQQIAATIQEAVSVAAAEMDHTTGTGLGMMRLQILKLGKNQLTGSLPPQWSNLREMRLLNLAENKLSGPLPVTWATMDKIDALMLNNNQLTGPLPDYWARFANITKLDLSNNQLSGKLPGTWVALQNVMLLDLSNNDFSDVIPEEWMFMNGGNYALRCLVLAGNNLQGLPEAQETLQEGTLLRVMIGEKEPSCKKTYDRILGKQKASWRRRL